MVEIKSRFEVNDKVQFLLDEDLVLWIDGVIIELSWDKEERVFSYLIERKNKERLWIEESKIIPKECEAE